MTDRRVPVRDWATDFDHTDPAWTADPYPIWDDLRQRCPVAHTERYGGAWLPVGYDLVREVAYDTEHFTSRTVVVPVGVILRYLGFPQHDADIFRRFIHRVVQEVNSSADEREQMLAELDEYMDAQIDDHLAHPRDDLTSFLLDAEIDGSKLPRAHIRGTMTLLMIAGIDTTWSAIGASLWHLAQHPGDRHRVATEAPLMDTAVEELLRAYAPVTMARLVAKDHDFHGHRLIEGDWVLLPFPAANRDPAAFGDPGRVDLDRGDHRNAAFGMGVHRCLGAHLATMELRVALEESLARYPDFELADPTKVTWSRGQIRGPRYLPVRIR